MSNHVEGLSEYFTPGDEFFEELLAEALIIPDTSVLLALYRLPERERDELKAIIARLESRFRVMHHTAVEFARTRPGVILEQQNVYPRVIKAITTAVTDLDKELRKLNLEKRHVHIDPSEISSKFSTLADDIVGPLEAAKEREPGPAEDLLVEWITSNLFSPAAGAAPPQEWIDAVDQEAKSRFARRCPPGYADDSKGTTRFDAAGRHYYLQYGDLYFWKQVLEFGRESGAAILVVTDDRKDDWFWREKGRMLGPRPELRREFRDACQSGRFWIYTLEQFVRRIAGPRHDAPASELAEFLRRRPSLAERDDSPDQILDSLIADYFSDLVNFDDQVTSAIAESGGSGFELSDYVVENACVDLKMGQITFDATLWFMGDRYSRDVPARPTIEVTVSSWAEVSDSVWSIVDHDVHDCRIERS
ncbi:MAG: PIN-like domain-containing protein [Deltaproteobacteria bacterium]